MYRGERVLIKAVIVLGMQCSEERGYQVVRCKPHVCQERGPSRLPGACMLHLARVGWRL